MYKRSNDYRLTKLCVAALTMLVMPQSYATYSNVQSMLDALRPTAAVNAPELNQLIIALDGLPTDQQKQQAFHTLSPLVDLSILSASESANRQMAKRLNQRVLEVLPAQGFASGDTEEEGWDEALEDTDSSTTTKADGAKADSQTPAQPATETKTSDTSQYDFTFEKEKADAVSVERDPNKGLWAIVLGSEAAQKNRNNVYGYDATLIGGIIGIDRVFWDRWVFGLAGGYQQSDVDSRGPSGSYIDVKRVNASFYGYYTCPSSFYIMGLLTGAQNRNDSNRKILVPPAGGQFAFARIATAQFNNWESHAHLEMGHSWRLGNLYSTPKVFTNYTHWDIESYQESDAIGLNLNVRNHDLDSFVVGGGLLLEYRNHFKRAIVIPYLQTYVLHDFIKDKQTAVSNMLGGGFDFLTTGYEPAGTTFEVGAGLSVHSFRDFIFDLQYDFAARSSYTRHNVGLKLRYEWA